MILFSGMAVALILKWLLYSFGVRAKQQKAMQLLEALNFQPLLKFLSLERGAVNWVNNHLHLWNETPVKVYTMRWWAPNWNYPRIQWKTHTNSWRQKFFFLGNCRLMNPYIGQFISLSNTLLNVKNVPLSSKSSDIWPRVIRIFSLQTSLPET